MDMSPDDGSSTKNGAAPWQNAPLQALPLGRLGGVRPPVPRREPTQSAARLARLTHAHPRNQLEAALRALRIAIRSTVVLCGMPADPTKITDAMRADLREAMDIVSLCMADMPASGKEIIAAKGQSGFLVGPHTMALLRMPNKDAVQTSLQMIATQGLPTSEGVRLLRGFAYAADTESAPRVFVAARGEREAVRALVTGLQAALDVPEGYYLACDCVDDGSVGVRAVVFVEASTELMVRAWPRIREQAGEALAEYVEAVDEALRRIDAENGRLDDASSSPLARP